VGLGTGEECRSRFRTNWCLCALTDELLWWQLSALLLKEKSNAPFLHGDGRVRCMSPCSAPVPNFVCDLKPPVQRVCAQMLYCKLAQLRSVQTLPCIDFPLAIKHQSVFPLRRDYEGISFSSIRWQRTLLKLPKKSVIRLD